MFFYWPECDIFFNLCFFWITVVFFVNFQVLRLLVINLRDLEHDQHLFEVCDLISELICHYLTNIDCDVQQVVKPHVHEEVEEWRVCDFHFLVEPDWVISFYCDLCLYHTWIDSSFSLMLIFFFTFVRIWTCNFQVTYVVSSLNNFCTCYNDVDFVHVVFRMLWIYYCDYCVFDFLITLYILVCLWRTNSLDIPRSHLCQPECYSLCRLT